MENWRRQGLICLLLCAGISIVWGTWITRNGCAWIDFRTVYAGARCLVHHHNPYNAGEVEREYLSEGGQRPKTTHLTLQCVTLQVNLPATYVLVAPFAALSWGPAHILWMLLTGVVFVSAILLAWDAGASSAPLAATVLSCMLALNCQIIFTQGNTAGIVVGLCGIAVWCLLKNRCVWVGVLCLAFSLAVKPHDTGLVWLYFLLAGGVHRKRALQSAAITAAIGLSSVLWVSHVAPHWMQDLNANLSTISAPGGVNDPGPNGVITREPVLYSIVDLQTVISVFRDDPHFYNSVSYLLCGGLFLVWSIVILRSRFSVSNAWLALGAVVPLTLLINYHRLWDAKLVMLVIPACCLLWAERGPAGKAAIAITSISVLLTGEISLVTLQTVLGFFHVNGEGLVARLFTILSIRPASIALLATGVFYLCIYMRRNPGRRERMLHNQPEREPIRASS